MDFKNKVSYRRVGIVINYLSVLSILIIFQIGKTTEWDIKLIAGETISVIIAILTFFSLHVKTNLWNLVHRNAEELDEREIQLTNWSLRYAYAIFTVLVLLLLMANAIYEPGAEIIKSLGQLLVICLLYFAHSLPASVISWRKSESI